MIMQGNITVAGSWNDLNDWQLQEIAHLYLNTPVDDFADAYLKMIFIVYQKSPDTKSRLWLRRLLKEVPVSELEKHTKYLKEKSDLFRFPDIPGLIKPADRIENISIIVKTKCPNFQNKMSKKTAHGRLSLSYSIINRSGLYISFTLVSGSNVLKRLS